MASIKFDNFQVDIVVHNMVGGFDKIFNVPFPRGYWVLLTIQNDRGEREIFPRVDEDFRIKTFDSYEEAIDDIAKLLKKYFK